MMAEQMYKGFLEANKRLGSIESKLTKKKPVKSQKKEEFDYKSFTDITEIIALFCVKVFSTRTTYDFTCTKLVFYRAFLQRAL